MAAALIVDSVAKCFMVQRKRLALVESMIQYLARRHGRDEILWARNVTYSVEQGQVFGIIGHNGAVHTQATARRFLAVLERA